MFVAYCENEAFVKDRCVVFRYSGVLFGLRFKKGGLWGFFFVTVGGEGGFGFSNWGFTLK